MKQNNTVNIYEEYFQDKETDHCSEPPFAKGLAVFRDPSQLTRSTTSVNWHPEGSNNGKLAVSYAVLNFQDERLNNPNLPASVRESVLFLCSMCITCYHPVLMLIHHSLPHSIHKTSHTFGILPTPTNQSSSLFHPLHCVAFDIIPRALTLSLEGATTGQSPTTIYASSQVDPTESASLLDPPSLRSLITILLQMFTGWAQRLVTSVWVCLLMGKCYGGTHGTWRNQLILSY